MVLRAVGLALLVLLTCACPKKKPAGLEPHAPTSGAATTDVPPIVLPEALKLDPPIELPANPETLVSAGPPVEPVPAAEPPAAKPAEAKAPPKPADERARNAGDLEARPATPRLLPDASTANTAGKGAEITLARADQLLATLRVRELDAAQRKDRDAGATFMVQAREALAANDPARAGVLADKALALIENLEVATRR